MKRAMLEEGLTHAERVAELEAFRDVAVDMPKRTPAQQRTRQQLIDHVDRLLLIYKPFPVVLRRQSAMIHSGTIVGDRFFGDGHGGPVKKHRDVDGNDWANHAYIRESEAVIA